MAVLQAAFPDAENVMISLLEPLVDDPAHQVVTAAPEQLVLPTILVRRIGGSNDSHSDFPNLAVTCFAATRPQAWALAEQIRQVVLASRRTKVNGVLVDNAETVTPAVQMPEENEDLRSVMAVYRLSMRRPRFS